jgi:hypothetical protein
MKREVDENSGSASKYDQTCTPGTYLLDHGIVRTLICGDDTSQLGLNLCFDTLYYCLFSVVSLDLYSSTMLLPFITSMPHRH